MHAILTRRKVLQALAAVCVSGAATGWGEKVAGRLGIHLGAQTNAWRIDPKDFNSFLAVLEQIHQVGYEGFETGFANVMPQFSHAVEARRRIANTGLRFFGIHIFLPPDRYDPRTKIAPASLYEQVAAGGAALGAQHLIFSSLPAKDAEELRRKAAGLNAAGRYSKGLGIPLAYHNEQNTEGTIELEALYATTDSEYVSFLLDAGHAYRAGVDVPAFLRKHHGRIVGLHLRDYRDGKQVPLGQGTFPLAEVAAVLKRVGWHGWVLNEEERDDGTKAGLKFIGPAFHAMRRAFAA